MRRVRSGTTRFVPEYDVAQALWCAVGVFVIVIIMTNHHLCFGPMQSEGHTSS